MTKIYLVKGHYYKDQKQDVVNLNVFTNKKLAKTYCEYKNITKSRWIEKGFDEVIYKIEEFTVMKIDWNDNLIKEQMKQLPY